VLELGELGLETATFPFVGRRFDPGLQVASFRLLGRSGVDEAVHTPSIADAAGHPGALGAGINSDGSSPMVILAVTFRTRAVRTAAVGSTARGGGGMSQVDHRVVSRPRACLVCADELPPVAHYVSWLCPECLVATDSDATRPRPADFSAVLGRPDPS
jgi:hypothetical protein